MASNFAIRHAAHQVLNGGVIVYPTDTVYGLGCDPLDHDAVRYLCDLKQRDISKGLVLVASELELFHPYIEHLDADARSKITSTGSTPTSWVVSANRNTPPWLTGYRDTLVIRVTAHPVINKLCRHLGHPLVSSSANPGGRKPALNGFQAHRYFHGLVDAILVSNEKCSGRPSIIRQPDSDRILRS